MGIYSVLNFYCLVCLYTSKATCASNTETETVSPRGCGGVPEELLVPAERLPVDARAQSPAAAESRTRAQVQLLVLRVAVPEVAVLPLVIERDLAGQRLETFAALVEPRAAMLEHAVRETRP